MYTVHFTQLTDGRSSSGSLIYTRYIRSYSKSSIEGRPDSHASGFRACVSGLALRKADGEEIVQWPLRGSATQNDLVPAGYGQLGWQPA